MKKQQSGFTLVEIAIVLVIIGLLLGGVLKGQELIYSAKSKAVVTDIRNISTMVAAYQDRFKVIPGDDPDPSSHWAAAAKATGGTLGNGQIEGLWNSTTPTDESVLMWQHLRLANLMAGDTTTPTGANLATWRPHNTENGMIGVQSAVPAVPIIGMQGRMFICLDQISGRIAQQVDSTMDDGKPDSGSVQVTASATGAASVAAAGAPLNETAFYTLCAGF